MYDPTNLFLSGTVFGMLIGGLIGIGVSNLINGDKG